MNWDKEYKYDVALKSLCIILNPVLGMLASLYRINTRSSFVVLFISFITFGLALCTPDFEREDFNYDVVRYRNWFEKDAQMDNAQFKELLVDYFNDGFVGRDIFLGIVNFGISRFTNNYHVLFLVVAFIFGFFLLKSLHFFVSENNYRFSVSCLLLLFVFTLAGIDKINIIRWFWAYWITIYSLFRIYVSNDKKYYLLLCSTPIVHASFVVMLLIIVLAKFLHRGIGLLPLLLIVSLVISPFVLNVSGYVVPLIFGERFSLYIDSFYIYEINESGSGFIWLRRLLEQMLLINNTVVALVFTRHFHSRIKSTKCESLYYILMTVVLFVNCTISIPSVGSRFIMLVYPLIAYIFLVCFYEQRFRNLIYFYSGFILCCILTFSRFYQLPCLVDYIKLWEPGFYLFSPIYSVVKYLILY